MYARLSLSLSAYYYSLDRVRATTNRNIMSVSYVSMYAAAFSSVCYPMYTAVCKSLYVCCPLLCTSAAGCARNDFLSLYVRLPTLVRLLPSDDAAVTSQPFASASEFLSRRCRPRRRYNRPNNFVVLPAASSPCFLRVATAVAKDVSSCSGKSSGAERAFARRRTKGEGRRRDHKRPEDANMLASRRAQCNRQSADE